MNAAERHGRSVDDDDDDDDDEVDDVERGLRARADDTVLQWSMITDAPTVTTQSHTLYTAILHLKS